MRATSISVNRFAGNFRNGGGTSKQFLSSLAIMRSLKLVAILFCALATSELALAQSTSTFNGRVVDPAGAVVPGATVTAANVSTAGARSTTTNGDGLYSITALEPGTYDVKVEQSGFAPSIKKGVTLVTSTTLTLDFSLAVAGTTQEISVSGEAALVETTQSEVAGSLQQSEVQSLPMLNRNFTGLVELVPGARPAPILNTTKAALGPAAISVGGGAGQNVHVNVDGVDNEDNMIGGPLQNYSLEGIQEFKLLAHDYGVEYGRTNGSTLQLVTKSGTNNLHGSLFAYGRNDAMTAIDYLANPAHGGLGKPSFERVQAGASVGGPIKKDKLFYFGAYERIQQQSYYIINPTAYNQAVLYENQFLAKQNTIAQIHPTSQISQPLEDNLTTFKTDYQVNSKHSLFIRVGSQVNSAPNDQFSFTTTVQKPDTTYSNEDKNNIWSAVLGETWVISSRSVNQFAFQFNDYHDSIADQPFGPVPLTATLSFPSFTTGRISGTDQFFVQKRAQFKDDFSHQMGNHALKFGADFAFYPDICICTNISTTDTMTFFNDPAQILASQAQWAATPASCGAKGAAVFGAGNTVDANHCGPYFKGFLTPGANSAMTLGTYNSGGGIGTGRTTGMKQFGAYVGDDWKIRPNLTLNLGVRYDIELNFYDQPEVANNRTYQALQAIGSPYAKIFNTPKTDFGPRAGFAWDITGNGKNVVRVGAGIFWNEPYEENTWSTDLQNKPVLFYAISYANSFVPQANPASPQAGLEQLGTYVFGGPLPAAVVPPPASPTSLTRGASGLWINPNMSDPYNEQLHAGYTHQLTGSSVISADYTHILGIHEFRPIQLNPTEGPWDPTDADKHIPWGTRLLTPALNAAIPPPAGVTTPFLQSITINGSDNRSQYDEMIVHYEHRSRRITLQATYTLSRAYGFGGVASGITSGAGATPVPQVPFQLFGPGEWGPTITDERHRVVLSGVFNLPWGIQASPILEAGSARPYNLTTNIDCNGDGTGTTDRLFVNSTGGYLQCTASGGTPNGAVAELPVNYKRGDPSYDLDARFSKIFRLRSESRSIAAFAEIYNLTNHTNFGNNFGGNFSAASFGKPTGYLAGLPPSRELQLGARFTF